MTDYYYKYKKYKNKYAGKCNHSTQNICGEKNGRCTHIGVKSNEKCICNRQTNKCVKINNLSGLQEKLRRLESIPDNFNKYSNNHLSTQTQSNTSHVSHMKCFSNCISNVFQNPSHSTPSSNKVKLKSNNPLEDMLRKRKHPHSSHSNPSWSKVKQLEKQLKMGLPPLGVRKNIMDYMNTLDKNDPERVRLNELLEKINIQIESQSTKADSSDLLVNPLANNYSGLLESRAIHLTNLLKVKSRQDLGFKYSTISQIYHILLDDPKIKTIYNSLSKQQEKQLIKKLFNKLRSNPELRKTNRNTLFSLDNLKKIRKDIDIETVQYTKQKNEYDPPPISNNEFKDDNDLPCRNWLSSRAIGPLTGAEANIKKRVCKYCKSNSSQDSFSERYDPESRFCKVCCK
jgi:hypothetical protein